MPYNKSDPEARERNRLYQVKWYQNNKSLQAIRARASNLKAESKAREYIKSVRQRCTDCGNSDERVLEFDHLRDKKYAISQLVKHGCSLDLLKEEIAKCEVVCANCHRIRTHTRRIIQSVLNH